ncbi:MAG: hypothetical protein DYG89_21200 [Caldilinea sp. CFX5]|nr:hypothetical protein [Caldilinea sp. CFX5]
MLKKLTSIVPPENTEGQLWRDAKSLINQGAITPFISHRLATDIFGGEALVATSWAADEQINSPLSESENRSLARVAHYYSVQTDDRRAVKEYLLDSLKGYLLAMAQAQDPEGVAELAPKQNDLTFSAIAHQLGYPQVVDVNRDPLRLLAEMPLPIYITTCYHDFLEVALSTTGRKTPVSEIFYWNDTLYHIPSIWDREAGYQPTPERPLVYHLYGIDAYPESLVVSEDDYFDCFERLTTLPYLVNSSNNNSSNANPQNNKGALPAPIKIAIAGRSLLLLGYAIDDWDFRVLFRGLIQSVRAARVGNSNVAKSISIQLVPQPSTDSQEAQRQERIQAYLKSFFKQSKFDVYWGTLDECVNELWAIYQGS